MAAQKGRIRQGRKGSKSNGRKNSLGADALKHLCDECIISLRASFECQHSTRSLYRVHGDESGHGVSFPSLAGRFRSG